MRTTTKCRRTSVERARHDVQDYPTSKAPEDLSQGKEGDPFEGFWKGKSASSLAHHTILADSEEDKEEERRRTSRGDCPGGNSGMAARTRWKKEKEGWCLYNFFRLLSSSQQLFRGPHTHKIESALPVIRLDLHSLS